MKNAKIAIMLRYHRQLKKLSVKDVSNKLKDYGVVAAPKTIYAWEKGTTQPSADTLMLLCELYEITNVLETFGYTHPDSQGIDCTLTAQEKHLLTQYRKYPEMHNAVHQLLKMNPSLEAEEE